MRFVTSKEAVVRVSNALLFVAVFVCSRITTGCNAEDPTPTGKDASAADTVVDTSRDADTGLTVPEVVVETPTAEDAFSYLWYVLTRMPFYNQNGYQVDLPNHPEFVALAANGVDAKTDRSHYLELFVNEVYDADEYAAGLAAVHKETHTVRAAFPVFERVEKKWGFVVHQSYLIRLTLYGPGGSYDPATGMVILKTTPLGTFNRPNPSHTIVHEMVHMGVQHLVDQFKLTHGEKERLVDLFCILMFAEILPGYQGQSIGDRALDPYVTKQAIEDDLPGALAAYVASKS